MDLVLFSWLAELAVFLWLCLATYRTFRMYSGDSRPKDPMAAVVKKQGDESAEQIDRGKAQVLKWASLLACFLFGGAALNAAYGLVTYLGGSL